MTTTHGVWIDDPVAHVKAAGFWDKMVDHGFRTGAIMLEGMGDGFNPSYSTETLEVIGKLAHDHGCELVLTLWPEPDPKYMTDFETKIGPLLKACGAAGLEFDCEGNWLPEKLRGYASLDKAGDAFVAAFEKVAAANDVRIEVTTYPYHTENSKTADVAPHADRLLPQAYSVYKRKVKGVDTPQDWDGPFGPGKMQATTIARAKQVKGFGTTSGPLLSVGVASYDQVWPGRTGEQAIQAAVDAVMKEDPLEIRTWSSKWVFGIMANGYASRFWKSLKR